MEFRITSAINAKTGRVAGVSLVEYLVSVAVVGVVLMIVVPLVVFGGRSFASLANYADLNATGVNAMDQMTKDIRQAVTLIGFATNQLTFDPGSNQPAVIFTYNPTNRTLTRQQGTNSKALLTECDSLSFTIYQGTPLPGAYDQYPVADTNTCKVVAVNWTCSRTILGAKVNTDSAQSAKIVIRKH